MIEKGGGGAPPTAVEGEARELVRGVPWACYHSCMALHPIKCYRIVEMNASCNKGVPYHASCSLTVCLLRPFIVDR